MVRTLEFKRHCIVKMSDRIILFIILMMGISCGKEGDTPSKVVDALKTELKIDIEFPNTISIGKLDDIRRNIEVYRLIFSGKSFQPKIYEIERKKISQFSFFDIPPDDRLSIVIEALGLNRKIKYCTGEMIIRYVPEKNDHLVLPMRCI